MEKKAVSQLLTAIIMIMVPALAHAGPSIFFPELKYSFGSVSQQEKAEHYFEFLNKGDQDLVVEKVSAS